LTSAFFAEFVAAIRGRGAVPFFVYLLMVARTLIDSHLPISEIREIGQRYAI